MPYRQRRTSSYMPKRPRSQRRKKGVYYCPKCVDEQVGCPYHFAPGNCPEHPETKLIFDPELTEMLGKEEK